MNEHVWLAIYGAVCYFGIIVGSVLSFIAPEEISSWKKTYELMVKIIFLATATITIHFTVENILMKILFYLILILFLSLRIKFFLSILIYLLPILLMINLRIEKLRIVKDTNSILLFLNLIFFGLLESYFLIPNVFDKNRKYLKREEMRLIIKKTAKIYLLINLLWLILLFVSGLIASSSL
jgi:hypothetical protein